MFYVCNKKLDVLIYGVRRGGMATVVGWADQNRSSDFYYFNFI
jgi:hypothetical protein